MEEQGMGERAQSFHALSEPATFPVLPHVYPLGSSPTLYFSVFIRLHYTGAID